MSPMAGKSWQPSHEPPCRKGKKAPITLKKQWKEGGKGWETAWMMSCYTKQCCKYTLKAHGIQTHAHMQKTREC